MHPPGLFQLLVIALIVLVLFGRGRISAFMGDFGKGVKTFRRSFADDDEPARPLPVEGPDVASTVEPQPAPRSHRQIRRRGKMLGIDWEELLVIIVVAVVVIGPKDMPMALRTAGRWIARVRRVSNHFKSGIEAMIREAEMEEMEKKWAAQNEKILREHPADAPPEMEPTGAYPSRPAPPPAEAAADADEPQLPLNQRN